MKTWLIFSSETGEVIKKKTSPETSKLNLALAPGEDAVEADLSEVYVDITTVSPVPFPAKPSPHHEWDWTTKSWLPNLDAARESKLQQVAAELNARLYLPCNGFDADNVSRERISGTIARLQRGDGLPAGWLGWRDASNDMHWAADDAATVLTSLTALSRAIEDREQALLIATWQHKAAIAALEDIDAILAYDVTAGWQPSQI